MEVGCDGSEVVVRFAPFSAPKLEDNAEATFRDDQDRGRKPRYGVSVLAGRCEAGESIADTVERICMSSGLSGGRKVAVVTGQILRDAGFELIEDKTANEPLHHLVGADPFDELPDAQKLESLFQLYRMDNPKSKGTS